MRPHRSVRSSTRVLALVATLAVALGGAVSASDWTQYRGSESRGVVDQGLPEGEGELGFERRWIRDLGSGYAGVVVAGDRLVAAFAAGERDVVAAFDRDSGEELWRYDLEPTYSGHDGSHDGPIATPLIADGRVFALGAWGRMAALGIEDGEELWALHLVDDLELEKPWYGFGSSPLAVDGKVVVGGAGEAGTLIAFDQGTGEVAWRSGTDPINYQSPIVADFGAGGQVVIGGQATVFAVAPADGELLWSYEHGGGGARGAASLTVLPVGERRIFIDHDDRLSALLEIGYGDEGWGVEKVWEGKALINSYIPPVERGEALFGYSTRFLTAVDESSGEILFRSREPGDGFPLIVEDQMVILTKAGTLHLGPVTSEGWSESTSMELFADHAWTAPAYADGSLYLRSLGQLARVDLMRGTMEAGGSTSGELPPRIAEIIASEDPSATADRLWAESAPPWIDGDRITFVWRGEAEEVGIGGDMIGARADASMERIEGTDVWWYSASVPEGSRINYAFMVDYGPATTDPSNPRTAQSTLYGPDMNLARPDGAEMSWIGMPGWVEPDHYQEPPEGHPRGTVDELEISFQPPARDEESEAPEPVTIGAAVWTPPGYAKSEEEYDVAYVMDGKARTLGGWVNTLDRLVGERFAPAVVVFLDMPRLPPPLQAQAFLEQVVPKIESTYRVGGERHDRALVGVGGSSVNSMLLAFSKPEFADRVALQSFHGIEAMVAPIKAAMEEVEADKPEFDIYLEWGVLDFRSANEGWNMHRAARDLHQELTSRGYRVTGGEVNDSSDWASWRNRTDVVLETLFPLDATASPAGGSTR